MAVAALGLAPAAAQAGDAIAITVEPSGFDVFAPDEAQTTLGLETFVFEWDDPPTGDAHNIVSDDDLFTSGPPSLDGPDYALDASAGRFDYYCVVHADPESNGGMDGEVTVAPILLANPPPPKGTFRPAWALDATRTGKSFDVRYRIDKGKWRPWKDDTKMQDALFGEGGEPVPVQPSRKYRIQARSQKLSNSAKHSRWAPPLVVSG